MTASTEGNDSHLAVLLVGLFMIAVLQSVALLSATTHVALGVAVGTAELVVAWRLATPRKSRVLRWILAGFGALTVALSLYWSLG